MKNKLLDLNNYLFEQIERINDDTLTDDQLEKTIKKAEAINKTAENIIRNGELALKVVGVAAEYGFVAPEDFKEIGTVGIEYIADNTSLTEAKPSYKELEAALKKIARAKNSDFRNWHQVCNFMRKTAEEALKAGVLVAEGVK